MDGRIGHLRNHYRVVGARGTEVALAARLDRVVRDQLPAAFEDALSQAFDGDDAVYVLRRVKAGTLLVASEGVTDAGMARRWAERLAGAVVRSIAKDEGDGANLVRFDDQADYVTHFIIALLQGSAWGRWYYGAFAPLRTLATPDALRVVLLDNLQDVPVILGHLHRRGALDALLSALDENTLRALWRDERLKGVRAAPDSLRPLFAGALRIADDAGLWARARPDGETLFEIYAGNTINPADWRDRRALAVSLLDMLRFLLSQGYLRRADAGQEFLLQLDAALKSLDWLDAEWLRASLLNLLGVEGESNLPTRHARQGPTPRQRELLQTLASLLREEGLRLDLDEADSSSDALRLFAMLVSHAPQWADDTAAKAIIGHLLALSRWLRRLGQKDELMLRLRRGDIEGALRALAPGERAGAGVVCEAVARLGDEALELAAKLAGEVKEKPRAAEGILSACAGLSLLFRALLDARLHTLAQEMKYPSREELPRFGALLLALWLRLGGEAASSQERIDEGLYVLAGLKARPTLDNLRDAWADAGEAEHALFQSAMLRVAAGQRLLSANVMHLYRVELEGAGMALIAADETARLWPLGRLLKSEGEVAPTVTGWLDMWEAATGVQPTLVVDESDAVGSQELSEVHEAGRESLLAAWQSLRHGRLGLNETDLNLFLTACTLLRIWARWLRRFSSSSVPYLLENFIRRKGKLYEGQEGLLIELESAPLDIVIEMAGYFDELERVPWLEHGRVQFLLRGA